MTSSHEHEPTYIGSVSPRGALIAFTVLVSLTYLRLLGNLVGNYFYTPFKESPNAPFSHRDCSVIVTNTNPDNPWLVESLESMLRCYVKTIYIVTSSEQNVVKIRRRITTLRTAFPQTEINIGAVWKENKRRQIIRALCHVNTRVTIIAEDNVFWPVGFLSSALAPFTDTSMGAVTTGLRVRRARGFGLSSLWEFLGCMYVEKLNNDNWATHTIDKSACVISGHTTLYRSYILQEKVFQDGYLTEHYPLGKCGPLNRDDSGYFARWVLRNDDTIKVQACKETFVHTTIDSLPKSVAETERLIQDKIRGTIAMLGVLNFWKRHPWGLLSVYLPNLLEFPLLFDATIMFLFICTQAFQDNPALLALLGATTLLSKMIRPFPHFMRNPLDLIYFPVLVMYDYFQTLLKIKALVSLCAVWRQKHRVEEEEELHHTILWNWGNLQGSHHA